MTGAYCLQLYLVHSLLCYSIARVLTHVLKCSRKAQECHSLLNLYHLCRTAMSFDWCPCACNVISDVGNNYDVDIQCLQQGGRVALTSKTNKFLHREVMAAHGLLQLEQAKQIRQMIPLSLKQTQALEKACFLINYSLKQEPNKSSSLRTRCHKVLRAMTCHQVP